MKIIVSLISILSLLTVACGPTKNNPLENYRHLNLTKEAQDASQKQVEYRLVTETNDVVIEKEKIVKVEVKVPVIEKEYIYVNACPESLLAENAGDYNACLARIKQTAQELSVDKTFYEVKTYSDSGLLKEEAMIFTEGKESTYYINAKVLYPARATFELSIFYEPTTATVTPISKKDNSVTYKITWKPTGVLTGSKTEDKASIKIALADFQYIDANAYHNSAMQLTFEALSSENSETGKKEISTLKDILVKKADASKPTTNLPDHTATEGRR